MSAYPHATIHDRTDSSFISLLQIVHCYCESRVLAVAPTWTANAKRLSIYDTANHRHSVYSIQTHTKMCGIRSGLCRSLCSWIVYVCCTHCILRNNNKQTLVILLSFVVQLQPLHIHTISGNYSFIPHFNSSGICSISSLFLLFHCVLLLACMVRSGSTSPPQHNKNKQYTHVCHVPHCVCVQLRCWRV